PEQRLRHKLKRMTNVQYINADLDPRLADVQMDITAIPHGDNHFDLVICNHVLEHIPDDRLAMRELFRVLKPGGQAILQVPIGLTLEQTIEDPSITDPAEREVRFGQFDHLRIYGQDYSDRLAEAGFDVQVHYPQQFLGEELIERHALIGEELVYVGTK
ncbi:MAG: methyltransferase domain-containing protein, partial [Bacteroidota bacterium]